MSTQRPMRMRRDDLRTRTWTGSGDGGLVVWDPRSDSGHLLNPSSAVVFESCDGITSRDEVATRVAARTGLPVDVAIVDLALEELASAGLLDEALTNEEPTGVNRRTLMRRLALGAGAIALLPVIDTIGGASRLAADSSRSLSGEIPPLIAQDVSTTTPLDTPVGVTLSTTGGFVSPDSTAFLIDDEPTNGTVTLVGAVATYTPDPGFLGVDTFTYVAWQCVSFADGLACPDGTGPVPETGSDPATVTVTVGEPPPDTSAAPTTEEEQAAAATATRPSFTG